METSYIIGKWAYQCWMLINNQKLIQSIIDTDGPTSQLEFSFEYWTHYWLPKDWKVDFIHSYHLKKKKLLYRLYIMFLRRMLVIYELRIKGTKCAKIDSTKLQSWQVSTIEFHINQNRSFQRKHSAQYHNKASGLREWSVREHTKKKKSIGNPGWPGRESKLAWSDNPCTMKNRRRCFLSLSLSCIPRNLLKTLRDP